MAEMSKQKNESQATETTRFELEKQAIKAAHLQEIEEINFKFKREMEELEQKHEQRA